MIVIDQLVLDRPFPLQETQEEHDLAVWIVEVIVPLVDRTHRHGDMCDLLHP